MTGFRALVSALFVSVVYGLATGAVQARPLAEVKGSGQITVFVYADYAPYSWRDGDQIKGIDADIARELAGHLGVRLNFLMRGADENVDDDLRTNVWKGDLIHRQSADVMMHVPYDKALQKRADGRAVLLAPYFAEQVAVVFDADKLPAVKTYGRFTANKIAVELDTASDFFLSMAFRGQLHRSIRRGRTFIEAVGILEKGEAPALMASRAQAEWVRHRNAGKNLQIAQPPAPGLVRSQWPIGIAVKGDSEDLGATLADKLAKMIASGEIAAICARYGVQWLAPAKGP